MRGRSQLSDEFFELRVCPDVKYTDISVELYSEESPVMPTANAFRKR